ncbi:MAG: hypothetical protein AAF743_04745 [Planctomycetota bacterium]
MSLALSLAAAAVFAAPTFAQEAEIAEAAAADTAVPVRAVTLFSSGVGMFRHAGSVDGAAETTLRFRSEQINDILKSLVLQDLDGGVIRTVTYPSRDPLSKTLASFQVDLSGGPDMSALLEQLRGAEVVLLVNDRTAEGTILGVETKEKPVEGGQSVTVDVLNLFTGTGLIAVPLDEVRGIELTDEKLQEELARALAALAGARDTNKKPVTISFDGDGQRRVQFGYVVETPVWKTSYRLVMGGGEGDDPNDAYLQGWAIVENQTDFDWDNVQLSLVSGRPISFIQDLYEPLYVPRPVVVPELYASLRPQRYEGGLQTGNVMMGEDELMEAQLEANRAMGRELARRRAQMQDGGGGGAFGGGGGGGGGAPGEQAYFNPTQGVATIASGSDIGELFQYTVGSVSLARQSSAMIPVVTDPIEAEAVSIYNNAVMPRHPLNGAWMTNTTDKHLLAGPMTVYTNEGAYQGDAQVDNLPPGQSRLISYGIDLNVVTDVERPPSVDTLLSATIDDGVLIVERLGQDRWVYTFQNKADAEKIIVIEHPRNTSWELFETAEPFETTEQMYRFRIDAEGDATTEFSVTQRRTYDQRFAILDLEPRQIMAFVQTNAIDDDVREALKKIAERKRAVVAVERQIAEAEQAIVAITQEQDRIRQNMRTVERNSNYYNRLMKKLDEQETQIEGLQTELEDKRDELEQMRAALSEEFGKFTVGKK